jgi:hypothetical protein
LDWPEKSGLCRTGERAENLSWQLKPRLKYWPMNKFLVSGFLAALVLYALVRPRWRHIGPSLLDSFVIGLFLFAVGSILVWNEGIADSEAVMRIGVSTALSGILGASIWGVLFAPKIAGLNFFTDARSFDADPIDHFVISAGFVVCSLISLILLIAVMSHDHIRALLLGALFRGSGELNDARIIISSGAEGYFAPGYVKQFRDVIVPILCVAAILCGGTYRHRGLFYAALLIAIATTLVSGQRSVIFQYVLCLGGAFLIDRFSSRPKFASLPATLLLILFLVGAVAAMTKLLGRLEAPHPSSVEYQERQLHERTTERQTEQRLAFMPHGGIGPQRPKTAGSSPVTLVSDRKEVEKVDAGATKPQQSSAQPQSEGSGTLLGGLSKIADFSDLSTIVGIPISLAHRAVVAVPRENTTSYPLWAGPEHAPGAGWLTDLASIRPGVQKQLSNELSWVNKASRMGNSPLGLGPDVFTNWGWLGVMIIPALFALGFLWLDIALTASRSALTSAAKIFMFFSIPLMYSPFMFVLYGGFVAVGILCYAWLRRNGALSFLGIRPQTEQLSL